MGESDPPLRAVLDAVNANGVVISEIRDELGEIRVGLGEVQGRQALLDGKGEEQGKRLDRVEAKVIANGEGLAALSGEVGTLGRETLLRELPQQLLAAVMTGIERSAYAVDLRALQAAVAELQADVAELKRARG